jgi:beta-1,4-mannosyl-glycoprotein beta-1,4-N-acetylglucosaminyltransferase
MFNKELDMLEFRLKELYDYVDYFILIESTKTHTNDDKELYYNINKNRYQDYSKKIIHIVLDDDIIKNLDKLCPKNVTDQWIIENGTRIFLTQFILINDTIKEDDIIIIFKNEILSEKEIKRIGFQLSEKRIWTFRLGSLPDGSGGGEK